MAKRSERVRRKPLAVHRTLQRRLDNVGFIEAQYEKKKARWEKHNRRGGQEPKPPAATGPDPTSQSHLTDPDSRIMRKSKNEAFGF